jgi:hypothetical protein
VEKLASVLWKPADQSAQAFADALLAAAPELSKQGAMRLRIDVTDDAVAEGAGVTVGRMDPPKAAVVFYWLDLADDRAPVEAVLERLASRVETFLVVEAVPLANTSHVAPLGQRTPGFNFVTCIERKQGLSDAEFIEHWHVEHRRCAIATQTTFSYVRNEIVRAYSDDPPSWEAIVEEAFPIEALTDPKVWYKARNDEELEKNRGWMIQSCLAFLALDRIEAHPMSEYVFER